MTIELFVAFLLSKNFALILTAVGAVLSVAVGYIKNKTAKDITEMLINGIEIANNPETKKVVKELAEGHARIKTIDFEAKVTQVTENMKSSGLSSIQAVVDDVESKTGLIKNAKILLGFFQKK